MIDSRSNYRDKNHLSFVGKFSSQEFESQYNLIKMLLAANENYKNTIDAIKKNIVYSPLEF